MISLLLQASILVASLIIAGAIGQWISNATGRDSLGGTIGCLLWIVLAGGLIVGAMLAGWTEHHPNNADTDMRCPTWATGVLC